MTTIIDCDNCEGTGQVSELVSVRVGSDMYKIQSTPRATLLTAWMVG